MIDLIWIKTLRKGISEGEGGRLGGANSVRVCQLTAVESIFLLDLRIKATREPAGMVSNDNLVASEACAMCHIYRKFRGEHITPPQSSSAAMTDEMMRA